MHPYCTNLIAYLLKNKLSGFNKKYHIPSVGASLDKIDMAILYLIATGECRKNFSSILSRSHRTVENRLSKMRVIFECKNTSHLIAKLSVTPIKNIGEQEVTVKELNTKNFGHISPRYY